jgi:hypothetical protein
MSVCRFGDDSDVYVFYANTGGIECCRCDLLNGNHFNAPDEAGMIVHLEAHLAAGHKVPPKAFERLRSRDG